MKYNKEIITYSDILWQLFMYLFEKEIIHKHNFENKSIICKYFNRHRHSHANAYCNKQEKILIRHLLQHKTLNCACLFEHSYVKINDKRRLVKNCAT